MTRQKLDVRTLVVALALVAAALGTAATAADAATDRPLRVGTNLPAPGFWVGDNAQSITGGYEYDLARTIAAKVGYRGVTVVDAPFDDLLEGKPRGIDLALSQALITRDHSRFIAFSVPYLELDLGILVNAGTAVPDLATARKLRWGVSAAHPEAGAFLERTLKAETPPQTYDDLGLAINALEAHQIDAVLDYTLGVLREADMSAGKVVVARQFRTGDEAGAILRKGSKLLGKVNRAIKALKADGTLTRLSQQYLGGDPAKVAFLGVRA